MPDFEQNPKDVSLWDAFPRGIILPWYGAGKALPKQFEDKWGFCDGTHETPDLTDRFLMGVKEIETLGSHNLKGEKSHQHTDIRHRTDPSAWRGEGFEAQSADHALGYTEKVDHIPPYCQVRYIMKL